MEKTLKKAVRKVLLKAAALLERRGFVKGIREDERGRHCVVGAIDRAAGFGDGISDHKKGPVWATALGAITKEATGVPMTGDIPWQIVSWNNAKSRRRRQVVAKLRSAAKLLD